MMANRKIMEKLVFDFTYCSEPECWEWDIPFEYESKEKFIFDVLENPMILDKLGIISVYQFQIELTDYENIRRLVTRQRL